jgi:hypothetical protein
MVCRRIVFGEVVSQIVRTTAPMDNEVALGNLILNPIEAHVNGFGATLLYSSVCDACSTGVISLDWAWWLGMAHVLERCAKPSSFFSIVKQSTEFRFSGRGDNHFHDRTWDMDIAIDWWWTGVAFNGGGVKWGAVAQKEISTCTTS